MPLPATAEELEDQLSEPPPPPYTEVALGREVTVDVDVEEPVAVSRTMYVFSFFLLKISCDKSLNELGFSFA